MIETTTWRIEDEFLANPDLMVCEVVTGATQYPANAEELEIGIWNSAVERKRQQLQNEGKLELMLRDVEGRTALYGKKPSDGSFSMVMVPGFQYRFAGFDPKNLVLQVERVIYSEIEALKSPEYRALFEREGLELPKGPIAPVLVISTADGYIAATVRGTGTNKYPGGICGIGGDIDDPSLTVGDHLLRRERIEEFSSFRGLPPLDMVLGLVYDKVLRKHDLPVFAQYGVAFQRMRKGSSYLPDVGSITAVSNRARDLAQYIVDNYVDCLDPSGEPWIAKPTPPFSADLFLAGKHLYGQGWANAVLKELPEL